MNTIDAINGRTDLETLDTTIAQAARTGLELRKTLKRAESIADSSDDIDLTISGPTGVLARNAQRTLNELDALLLRITDARNAPAIRMLTGPKREDLRAEVTGYITAYFEQADDGHPYYALQHPGKSARDMALDYMRERYRDYLEEMKDMEPDQFDRLLGQSPNPREGEDRIERAMEAFDQMFDLIWPDPAPDPDRLAAAMREAWKNHDENGERREGYLLDPDRLDDFAATVTREYPTGDRG